MKSKKAKIITITAISAISVVIVIAVVVALILNNKEKYRFVEIHNYDGDIKLERTDKEVKPYEGLRLIPDDYVETASDSKIELKVDEDKFILASENTAFSINAEGSDEEGTVTVDLVYGNALFTIENKLNDDSEFNVNTPNASLSVRGTTFNVFYDEENNITSLDVMEGAVWVKAGHKEIVIGAGGHIDIVDDDFENEALGDLATDENLGESEDEEASQFDAYVEDGMIYFGMYEGEPLAWDLWYTEGGSAYLITNQALDRYSFNDSYCEWSESSLRNYLNNEFLNEVFTKEEQEKILVSDVSDVICTDANNGEFVYGNSSKDKVYVPSIEEIIEHYGVFDYKINGLYAACPGAITDSKYYDDMIQSDKDEEIRIFGEEYANIVYGHEGEAWILRDVSPEGTMGITAESNHVIDRCGFTHPMKYGIPECIRPVIQVDKSFIDGLDGEINEVEKLDKDNASASADEEMMDDEMEEEAVEEDGNPFAEIINGDAAKWLKDNGVQVAGNDYTYGYYDVNKDGNKELCMSFADTHVVIQADKNGNLKVRNTIDQPGTLYEIKSDALDMFNLKSVLGVYVQENGGTDVWMVDDRFYYDLLESWDNSIEPSYHYEFIELSHSY